MVSRSFATCPRICGSWRGISPRLSVRRKFRRSAPEPTRQTGTSCCCILAKQSLDPALELALELDAVNHDDHSGVAETLFPFKDQARRGQKREGLSRTLRVPDQPAALRRLHAAGDDAVDGAALVLAQHGFPDLAIFDME